MRRQTNRGAAVRGRRPDVTGVRERHAIAIDVGKRSSFVCAVVVVARVVKRMKTGRKTRIDTSLLSKGPLLFDWRDARVPALAGPFVQLADCPTKVGTLTPDLKLIF
jgi:hypothetical protein